MGIVWEPGKIHEHLQHHFHSVKWQSGPSTAECCDLRSLDFSANQGPPSNSPLGRTSVPVAATGMCHHMELTKHFTTARNWFVNLPKVTKPATCAAGTAQKMAGCWVMVVNIGYRGQSIPFIPPQHNTAVQLAKWLYTLEAKSKLSRPIIISSGILHNRPSCSHA